MRDLVDPNPQGVAPPLLASLAGSHPRDRAAPFPRLWRLPLTPCAFGAACKKEGRSGSVLTLTVFLRCKSKRSAQKYPRINPVRGAQAICEANLNGDNERAREASVVAICIRLINLDKT